MIMNADISAMFFAHPDGSLDVLSKRRHISRYFVGLCICYNVFSAKMNSKLFIVKEA